MEGGVPMEPSCVIEETGPYSVLDLGHGIPQLLCDSLAFERLDCVRVRRSRHNDECDDCDC